jgi:hypothetical protein
MRLTPSRSERAVRGYGEAGLACPPIATKPMMTCDAILRRRASKRATASSKRENAACAPRERQRFELIGRFPGCAYACASSERTGTLRASLPGQRRSRSHGIVHAGVRDATEGAGDGASSGAGRAAVSVAGYRRRGCRAPCCSCLRLSRASFLRFLSFRQRRFDSEPRPIGQTVAVRSQGAARLRGTRSARGVQKLGRMSDLADLQRDRIHAPSRAERCSRA